MITDPVSDECWHVKWISTVVYVLGVEYLKPFFEHLKLKHMLNARFDVIVSVGGGCVYFNKGCNYCQESIVLHLQTDICE